MRASRRAAPARLRATAPPTAPARPTSRPPSSCSKGRASPSWRSGPSATGRRSGDEVTGGPGRDGRRGGRVPGARRVRRCPVAFGRARPDRPGVGRSRHGDVPDPHRAWGGPNGVGRCRPALGRCRLAIGQCQLALGRTGDRHGRATARPDPALLRGRPTRAPGRGPRTGGAQPVGVLVRALPVRAARDRAIRGTRRRPGAGGRRDHERPEPDGRAVGGRRLRPAVPHGLRRARPGPQGGRRAGHPDDAAGRRSGPGRLPLHRGAAGRGGPCSPGGALPRGAGVTIEDTPGVTRDGRGGVTDVARRHTGLPAWWEPLLTRLAMAAAADFTRLPTPERAGRESAVLVLLGEEGPDTGPDVLMLQRATTLRTHAGQPVATAEVARVERLPVRDLVDPANRLRVRHPSGWIGPAFRVREMLVWGFTAGVLSTLLEMGGWSVPWATDRVEELPGSGAAPVR